MTVIYLPPLPTVPREEWILLGLDLFHEAVARGESVILFAGGERWCSSEDLTTAERVRRLKS